MTKKIDVIGVTEIMNYIPHRYPFLLIDKLMDVVPNESAIGVKNVTVNENFFVGHFPGVPIMPGVLIIEAMAQTAGVVVCASLKSQSENLVFFSSIEEAKFRQTVVPGDQLMLHVQKERQKLNFWKFAGVAKVRDQVVAEATFTAKLIEKKYVSNS